jgi:hypothetical protein
VGPRGNIGGVNLVGLSRSFAYQRLLSMAREADVIGADVTTGGRLQALTNNESANAMSSFCTCSVPDLRPPGS